MTRFELACFRSDNHHLVVLSNAPPEKMSVEKVKYSLENIEVSYRFSFESGDDLYIMHHKEVSDKACLVLDGEAVYYGDVKVCLSKYHFIVNYLTLNLNKTPFTIEGIRAKLNGSKMDLEYFQNRN